MGTLWLHLADLVTDTVIQQPMWWTVKCTTDSVTYLVESSMSPWPGPISGLNASIYCERVTTVTSQRVCSSVRPLSHCIFDDVTATPLCGHESCPRLSEMKSWPRSSRPAQRVLFHHEGRVCVAPRTVLPPPPGLPASSEPTCNQPQAPVMGCSSHAQSWSASEGEV